MKLLFRTKSEKSLKYFSGVNSDFAALLIGNKKTLFVSSLEKKPKGNFIVKDLSLKEIFKELKKTKTLELNFKEITKANFDLIKKNFKGKIADCSQEIEDLREIKTKYELIRIKKAIEITEKIFEELFLKNFRTEYGIYHFLLKKCLDYGVKPAFDPCVASGKNSSNAHYTPQFKSPLQKGFCIIDFGVEYAGYCSDLTRMFYFGTPSERDLNSYKKVLDCIKGLEKEIKPGMTKIDVGFEMIHSIGHGIGLDIHERPNVGKDVLKVGSVITLEPGIYGKQGIRIEDNYLVTPKGLKRLSSFSRDLKIIKLNL
jgi:Xaa-Pro aminopeptidase